MNVFIGSSRPLIHSRLPWRNQPSLQARFKHARSTLKKGGSPKPKGTGARSLSKKDAVPKTQGEEVIYDRVPAWYSRGWVWVLIGADVLWTANGVDITFNKWTRKSEKPEKGADEYEPRPLWQRTAASSLIVVGGVCLAAGMLLMRRRVVRRVTLLDGGKSVSVRTAAQRKGQATVVPKEDCDLRGGRDDNEMVMKIKGFKGDYWLNLDDAKVGGIAGGSWEARKRLHEKWFGIQLLGRWSSGAAAVQGAWM